VVEGSQGTGVGVKVGGKGEGFRVGGRGVDVGVGMNMVAVIVGIGAEVGAGAQEARMIINSKKNLFIKLVLWSPPACWRIVRSLLLLKCYTPIHG
jgi:hypothetical protein